MGADSSLVSIIMPVYQIPETLLRHAIESILNQTYKNIELIIIDDGSKDHTGAICDEYAHMDHHVMCCHTANQGVSKARNRGLHKVQGDYVAFVDGDDSLEPYIIRQMVDVCMENKADCAICSCRHLYENDADVRPRDPDPPFNKKIYSREGILHELFYMGKPYDEMEITAVWGKLYARRTIKNVFFDADISIGEDFIFNYDSLKNASVIVCMDSKGYNYLLRADSAIHGRYKHKYIQCLDGFKKLLKKCDKSHRQGVAARLVNIAIVIFLMIPKGKDNAEDERRLIDFIKQYRKEVLFNPDSRFKVKASLLLSYLGFGSMKKIYNIFFQ